MAYAYATLPTDANQALVVNTFYSGSIAGYTADRTATLPASASVGDRIAIAITTGDDAYELLITANTGDTLNGIAGGTEWSRLFISGEVIVMVCIVADTTWIVEYDGRIAQKCMLESTNATSASHDTATKITLGTSLYDVGNIGDTTNSRGAPRRAGKYLYSGAVNFALLAIDSRINGLIYTGSSPASYKVIAQAYNRIANNTLLASGATAGVLAVGDFVELWGSWDVSGGSGSKSTNVSSSPIKPFLSVTEVL
jgi:hypothetical protein